MSIQDDIERKIQEMNEKLKNKKELSTEDMEILFLTNLIEEEGKK